MGFSATESLGQTPGGGGGGGTPIYFLNRDVPTEITALSLRQGSKLYIFCVLNRVRVSLSRPNPPTQIPVEYTPRGQTLFQKKWAQICYPVPDKIVNIDTLFQARSNVKWDGWVKLQWATSFPGQGPVWWWWGKTLCSRGSARLVFSPPPSLFARFSTAFLSALTRGSSLASFHPSFVLDFSLDEGDFNLMFLSALDIFYLDSLVFVVRICLVIYRMCLRCLFVVLRKSKIRWEIYVPLGNLSTFPLGINRWSVTLVQLSNTSSVGNYTLG